MPKITIKEIDLTTGGPLDATSNVVYVPGLAEKTPIEGYEFGKPRLYTNLRDFQDDFGKKVPIVKQMTADGLPAFDLGKAYDPGFIYATELLTKNKVDDISWLTITGTVTPSDPTNYNILPTGCTKVITIDNTNYVGFTAPCPSDVPGTTNMGRIRVVCRYNPSKGNASINENSYDRKELKLLIEGQNLSLTPTSYYSATREVDMAWTMCEFDIELNSNEKITILSADDTPLEVCYISVLC